MSNFIKCLLLVILVGNVSFAQTVGDKGNQTVNINRWSIDSFDSRSSNIKGSVYINEQYSTANISNSENVYAIKYNAYHDEMIIDKSGTLYTLPKLLGFKVDFIQLGKVYKIYNLKSKGKLDPSFFSVLVEGQKITLLAKEKIILKDEKKPNSGYGKYEPPTLERIKDKIYLGFTNFSTSELPSKKKDVLELFSSKSDAVANYAKENKLSFKKQEDLIKIFRHYNSL